MGSGCTLLNDCSGEGESCGGNGRQYQILNHLSGNRSAVCTGTEFLQFGTQQERIPVAAADDFFRIGFGEGAAGLFCLTAKLSYEFGKTGRNGFTDRSMFGNPVNQLFIFSGNAASAVFNVESGNLKDENGYAGDGFQQFHQLLKSRFSQALSIQIVDENAVIRGEQREHLCSVL